MGDVKNFLSGGKVLHCTVNAGTEAGTPSISYLHYTDIYNVVYIHIIEVNSESSKLFEDTLRQFNETIYSDVKKSISAKTAIVSIMDLGFNIWEELGFKVVFDSDAQEERFYKMISPYTEKD